MMRINTMTVLALAWLSGMSTAASADGTARILDSGGKNQGVLSVNQTAGSYNQQANLRAIVTEGSVSATASQQQSAQRSLTNHPLAQGNYRSAIEGASFAGSHGVIGVNQASGVGNQNVNSLTLSLSRSGQTEQGPLAMDDSLLASVQGQGEAGISTPTADGNSVLFIDDAAFAQASGIIQVNQVAGIANQASNTLSLRFSGL
ncbi:adhesin [Rhodobacteraceae bacterium CH30]|nr:adhesin [Rhodobacteraceae bacterium CH30]